MRLHFSHLEKETTLTQSQTTVGQPTAPVADPGETGKRGKTHTPNQNLLDIVLASLDDDKAEDVVQIDLRGKSSIADYMVIASGRSSRQVASIAEKLVERLKDSHKMSCKTEGKGTGDWVLIDAGDVIVHLFRPEVREFYQLEKMWMPTAGAAQ